MHNIYYLVQNICVYTVYTVIHPQTDLGTNIYVNSPLARDYTIYNKIQASSEVKLLS